MARYCRCGHREQDHQQDTSGYAYGNPHVSMYGACKVSKCVCVGYTFDRERWIREDERRKLGKHKHKPRQKK